MEPPIRLSTFRDGSGSGMRPGSKSRTELLAVDGDSVQSRSDHVATEEPMEIRLLSAGGERRTVAVTMRTPGNDFELAAGFLFSEGIATSRAQIGRITYCLDPSLDAEQQYNIVQVSLRDPVLPDLAALDRHFFTTSACGVCGKASLGALRLRGGPIIPPGPDVTPELLASLPEKLREAQGIFQVTGGLHAAALFDARGGIVVVREDVGRHNAMDKLVGWALLSGRLPLHEHIVMVSGRASFELLQKCYAAGTPIFCAVSAPSSLAVDVAREFGLTLVGFLRGRRFNIYAGSQRLRKGQNQQSPQG
jgi:FdhD protein